MTPSQVKLAAEVLPKCRTLTQAEEILGGGFQGEFANRNYRATAQTWGLFDAFAGRPETHSGLPVQFAQEYHAAFAIGKRIVLG